MDIQVLKDKILQLAIQGKLVEQDKNDEPASVLLKKIKEEREKLIKEKKIRKQKPLPEIMEEEKPFEIPESWEWVRLGEVTQFINGDRGRNYPSRRELVETGIPFINAGHLNDSEIELINMNYITDEKFESLSSGKIEIDDIIYCLRGTLGKCSINKKIEKGAIASSLVIIRSYTEMYENYLYYYLVSPLSEHMIKKYDNGTAQPNLSAESVKQYSFPLPPLEEQERIVKKIDQLFALIDTLDSNKEDLLEVINLTRNQVLQEAIQGKLVEQNPEDEPASILLEKIKEEKDKLIKEKKIRKPKKLEPIEEDEKPFDIPEGWEWVRLGGVSLINMGQSPKGDKVNDKEGMEFHQGKVCFGDKYLNKSDKYTTEPKKIARPNDILLSVRAPVGTINITDREVCIGRGLSAISSLGNINKSYYFYIILAFKEYLIKRATGTTFLAITASVVNEMIIPLPPLAEQRRIVEKVDVVMDMLDELEKQLNNPY